MSRPNKKVTEKDFIKQSKEKYTKRKTVTGVLQQVKSSGKMLNKFENFIPGRNKPAPAPVAPPDPVPVPVHAPAPVPAPLSEEKLKAREAQIQKLKANWFDTDKSQKSGLSGGKPPPPMLSKQQGLIPKKIGTLKEALSLGKHAFQKLLSQPKKEEPKPLVIQKAADTSNAVTKSREMLSKFGNLRMQNSFRFPSKKSGLDPAATLANPSDRQQTKMQLMRGMFDNKLKERTNAEEKKEAKTESEANENSVLKKTIKRFMLSNTSGSPMPQKTIQKQTVVQSILEDVKEENAQAEETNTMTNSTFATEVNSPPQILKPTNPARETKGKLLASFKEKRRGSISKIDTSKLKKMPSTPNQNLTLKAREEIDILDKLRSLSRNAYSVELSYNQFCIIHMITQLGIGQISKILGDVKTCVKSYTNIPSISELATKLVSHLDAKLKEMKKIILIAQYIDLFQKKGCKPSLRQLQQLQSFDNPDQSLTSDGSKKSPKIPLSPKQSPMSHKEEQVDLRKLAIKNSLYIQKKTSTPEIVEDSSNDSCKIKRKTPARLDSRKTVIFNEIKQILDANPPSLWNTFEMETESSNSKGPPKLISYSLVLPYRKVFAKTEGEEQMEAIFKNFMKPRRANFSFDLPTDLEGEPRLNISCTIEYTTQNAYFREVNHIRSNSLFIQAIISDEQQQDSNVSKAVTIDDFDVIKGLSSGAYGKVCLAKKRTSGDFFALKIIDREKTIEKAQEDFIKSEVSIMRSVNSDYIVKLYYSFQNENYLFFVMEYMNGGDLGNLLQNIGQIEEKYSRVYIAEMVLALECIHSINILHRDLKPDNILIDSTGHLKLTDFGLSKRMHEEGSRKWITNYCKEEIKDFDTANSNEESSSPKKKQKGVIGTPHYIAPETILDNKYTFATDWWALGIIAFEMMVGNTPYNGANAEEVFKNIINDKKDVEMNVGYNDDQISPDAASLISGFLTRDPEKRLGSKGTEEIRQHSFFQGLNWSALRKEEPPFVPQTTNMSDISYFGSAKTFKPESYSPNKDRPQTATRRLSKMAGFEFRTTNVESLAQKNIEDARNLIKQLGTPKSRTKNSLHSSSTFDFNS